MHIPSSFKEANPETLHQLIQNYPLGTLIVSQGDRVNVDHLPFYLKNINNEKLCLQSHIAKANPLWNMCVEGQEVLVVFHGPNAYVSPNFYPSKIETGKAVPTWNYSVVHVRGRIHFKHEGGWILQVLKDLSNFHETNQSKPWSISDAPKTYIDALVKAVVGFEIIVDDMVGNFKLSQNKSEADYAGVVKGLSSSGHESDNLLAKQMQGLSKYEV